MHYDENDNFTWGHSEKNTLDIAVVINFSYLHILIITIYVLIFTRFAMSNDSHGA